MDENKKNLEKIKKNVELNKYSWDLTDDKGKSIVSICDGGLPVTDLTVNKDNQICVCVPISNLSWSDIKLISDSM